MALTSEQKAELKQLLAEASPEPWEAFNTDVKGLFPSVYLGPSRRYHDDSGESRPSICINEAHDPKRKHAGASKPTFVATAKLIAFLRNHAEELLK